MRKEHSRNSSREEKEVLREALEQAELNRKEVVDLLLLLIRMSEDISPDDPFTTNWIAHLIRSDPSKMLKRWRSGEEQAEEEFQRYYASESDRIPF
jgi:hypothetical protein